MIPEIPYSTALHKDGSVNYDAFDSRTVLDWASDLGGLFGMQAEAILVFEDNGVTMPTRNRFIKSAIDRVVKEDDPDYFILDKLLMNIDISELLSRSYELSDSNVVSARQNMIYAMNTYHEHNAGPESLRIVENGVRDAFFRLQSALDDYDMKQAELARQDELAIEEGKREKDAYHAAAADYIFNESQGR